MKSLTIKDLEINKELNAEELSAVRGGSNFGYQGGQYVAGGSALSIGSPVVAVNAPSMTQIDFHPVTTTDLNLANVVASVGTGIFQR
jgi:natural product precursor